MNPRPPIPEWWFRSNEGDLLNADGQTDPKDGHYPVLARHVASLILEPLGFEEDPPIFTFDDGAWIRTELGSESPYDMELARRIGWSMEKLMDDPYAGLSQLAFQLTGWPWTVCEGVSKVWSSEPQDARDWAIEKLGWIRIAGNALELRYRGRSSDRKAVMACAAAMQEARPEYYTDDLLCIVEIHGDRQVTSCRLRVRDMIAGELEGRAEDIQVVRPEKVAALDQAIAHPYYKGHE